LASRGRDEPLAGSASTVRAFLLLETPGAWGVDAVSGSRLPETVTAHLRELTRAHGIRTLMIRAHGRQRVPGRTRVFAGWAHAHRPWLETTVLDDVEELTDLPLEGLGRGASPGLTPYDEPLFCVCTHGKHDACCAELGRPLCRAMHGADPEHTWEVSHIGGDRFAPNVLVLPHGLYYGRLAPEQATELVEAHRAGELLLPHLRGRSGLPMPVQAAEIALREHLRVRGVDALPVVSTEREGEEWTVVLSVHDVDWRVRVRSGRGEPHLLTCRALRENPGFEHIVLGIEQS
jgi:hypothetical protein